MGEYDDFEEAFFGGTRRRPVLSARSCVDPKCRDCGLLFVAGDFNGMCGTLAWNGGPCTMPKGHNIRSTSPDAHHHVHSHYRYTDRKDTVMRNAATIERERELAQARLDALEQELARAQAMPKEPKKTGTVIKFQVQYTPHGMTYTVVAFRSGREGAHWHTTYKNRPGPFTWDEILGLMLEDFAVRDGQRTLEFFQYDDSGKWVRA